MLRFTLTDPSALTHDEVALLMDSVETVLHHRAYTRSAFLVILLGKFRDDVRDARRMAALLPAQRGSEHLDLALLDVCDLNALAEAVDTLLGQFGGLIDDPELRRLLGDFRDILNAEKRGRAQLREGAGQDAETS
jgi:hypothetical protein